MKKNTLIIAMALATMSHTSFAQEEGNTACMSEPQRVEISSREFEYTCDALNGGEAVLSSRLNSSFARYFLDGTRKALITGLGDDNDVRPFSRRSAPFTDNDQALIEELLAAYTADIEGDSQAESSSSGTNVSTAIGRVSTNADDNTTTIETSTSGNASVSGNVSINGEGQRVSDSSGSAPQVAAPTPETTQRAPASSNRSGARVRITANSTDGVTVTNNGETQSFSESSGSLASSEAAPVTAPTQRRVTRRSTSNATVTTSSNGTTVITSNTSGNASVRGTVTNNGNTSIINERSGSLSQEQGNVSTETTTRRSGRTVSSARVTSSANSNGDIETNFETTGNASGSARASGGGNSETVSF